MVAFYSFADFPRPGSAVLGRRVCVAAPGVLERDQAGM